MDVGGEFQSDGAAVVNARRFGAWSGWMETGDLAFRNLLSCCVPCINTTHKHFCALASQYNCDLLRPTTSSLFSSIDALLLFYTHCHSLLHLCYGFILLLVHTVYGPPEIYAVIV